MNNKPTHHDRGGGGGGRVHHHGGGGGGGGGGLKHRLTQMLLRSSCTTTTTSTSTTVAISKHRYAPHEQPALPISPPSSSSSYPHYNPASHPKPPPIELQLRRSHRLHAPHVDISGARSSLPAPAPALPLPKKKERRVTETGELYETGECEGRKCPPGSPSSPSTHHHRHRHRHHLLRNVAKSSAAKPRRGNAPRRLLSNSYGFTTSSSADSDHELGLFSSDDDDRDEDDDEDEEDEEEETKTLFSSRSRSFSSDSSEFYSSAKKKKKQQQKKLQKKKKKKSHKNDTSTAARGAMESTKKEEGEGEGGSLASAERGAYYAAVVKRSRNPYADFRRSMVEMIVEERMRSARDVERLLQSYLALNAARHHPIIIRAFADIWDALFGPPPPPHHRLPDSCAL